MSKLSNVPTADLRRARFLIGERLHYLRCRRQRDQQLERQLRDRLAWISQKLEEAA